MISNDLVMRDMDIRVLRSFLSVAETGNMTASAGKLVQTQGAVSQQIKRLETALGHKLFLRSGRGLKLTAAGEKLLPQAQSLVAASDHILKSFRPTASKKVVRFGMPYDLVSAYLASTLEDFSSAFPEIEVELFCEASPVLKEMAVGHDLDLAMVEEPVASAQGEILRVAPLVWVGKPPAGTHTRRPLPISLVAESCAFRPCVHDALDEAGIEWRTVFQNGDINATMAAVRSGMSVTACISGFVPSGLSELHEDSGLPALPDFAISLYRSSEAPDVSTTELCAVIRRSVARALA